MREIRRGRSDDLPALIDIFWRGVHEGAAPRYSAAERAAWLPVRPDADAVARRLGRQTVFVAEETGRVTGFMTLAADAYLDLAYVLPEMRGKGVADGLLAVLVNHAAAKGVTRLTTRASDMARPFLFRHGWSVVAPAPQMRDTMTLADTDMALHIGG